MEEEINVPEDFMFELTEKELRIWRSQFVTSNKDKMGLRYLPYAFTEDGIAQLSTVLNSKSAIKVNLQIIRMFSRLRSMALSHADILLKLEQLEKSRKDEVDFKDRPKIGFKPSTGI